MFLKLRQFFISEISRPFGFCKNFNATENFAAGVVERLGLGYDVLRQARPDIIMVSSSGTGHTGPDKDYVAYGSLLQSYTGWNSISGYPGGEPIKGGLWADPWVGMELAMITAEPLTIGRSPAMASTWTSPWPRRLRPASPRCCLTTR